MQDIYWAVEDRRKCPTIAHRNIFRRANSFTPPWKEVIRWVRAPRTNICSFLLVLPGIFAEILEVGTWDPGHRYRRSRFIRGCIPTFVCRMLHKSRGWNSPWDAFRLFYRFPKNRARIYFAPGVSRHRAWASAACRSNMQELEFVCREI